jgi:hypothetical protein
MITKIPYNFSGLNLNIVSLLYILHRTPALAMPFHTISVMERIMPAVKFPIEKPTTDYDSVADLKSPPVIVTLPSWWPHGLIISNLHLGNLGNVVRDYSRFYGLTPMMKTLHRQFKDLITDLRYHEPFADETIERTLNVASIFTVAWFNYKQYETEIGILLKLFNRVRIPTPTTELIQFVAAIEGLIALKVGDDIMTEFKKIEDKFADTDPLVIKAELSNLMVGVSRQVKTRKHADARKQAKDRKRAGVSKQAQPRKRQQQQPNGPPRETQLGPDQLDHVLFEIHQALGVVQHYEN